MKKANTTRQTRRPGRARRNLYRLAAILVVLGAVCAAVWIGRIPIADAFAPALARRIGLPSLVYEIDRLDFGTVIIRDVRIGGGMTAETVEISFALRGAIAGELERVRIDGLVVRAIFDDGRVIVPGMSDGSDSALPLKLPGMPVFVTSSSFELATPQGLIVATGSVSVVPSEGGSALMEARLDIGGVADSPSGRVLVSGQGTADDFTGRLEAMDVTARIGGLILSQIDGEFHGRLRRTDGQVVLALSPATVLSRGRIGTDDGLTLSLAAPLALADGASHEAIWARDTAGALRLETGPLSLEAGGYEIRAAGLTVHADADGGRAQLTGADISSVSGPLLAHGVDADIGWDAHLNVEGHVQAAHVEYLSEVALVVPVAADIRLHTDEAGRLLANARLTDRSGDLRIDIAARHDIETGRGQAAVRVARIVLPSESSKLDRMFPVLAGLGMRAEGAVDLRADLSWRGTNFQGTADLLVELDHAATGEWSADNLIGVVHFDSLVPLSTSPAQEIKIGRLDVGIPITQGRMEVELRADGRIAGRIIGLDLFGGRVHSDAFLFDPGAGDLALLLHANDLQLDQVLRSADLGSLTSTGELSGEIPLTVISGEVAIIGGELRAAPGGGIITYTAGRGGDAVGASTEAMTLVMEALENFHYDEVIMRIDEVAAEEMELRFTLSGRNPDLYDGKPLVLNILIAGPLRDILNRGLETVTLPSATIIELGIFE